jgi:hypothetical protein
MPKGTVCPEIPESETGRIPTIVTRKSLIIWSHIMDHRKPERVTYRNGIQDFWSFSHPRPKSEVHVSHCSSQNKIQK